MIKKNDLLAAITPNWREVLRRWSFWLGAAGSLITSFALAAPDTALHVWALLPMDMKEALPTDFVKYVGIVLFFAATVAQLIKQRSIPRQ
jgi:hypothetical protein